MGNTSIFSVFLTGLFTGGLTCMAVQGGLLAVSIAQHQEDQLKRKVTKGAALSILSFLFAKIIAYTLLGCLLGLLGSVFQLSLITRTILQFFVVIFMLGTALNILRIHPIFRYFVIQPPRFLTRRIRRESKSKSIFAPAFLGAFTVFIPCGTTQAMMALAIVSGQPLYGAAILFAFTLGTSPIFFILGYFANRLGEALQQKFMKGAAVAIILLALYNLNGAIALTGSGWTFDNMRRAVTCTFAFTSCEETNISQAVQEANIVITADGYNPNQLTIKAGSPVKINLKNISGQGCTQAFTIPSLGIQKIIPLGQTNVLAFRAPQQTGPLRFMCSQGLHPGQFNVID